MGLNDVKKKPRHVLPTVLTWFALWAVIVVCALAFRPIMPVDETRYVSVAWEMWTTHDYLVPHLNGEPYAHKPPLLFWADVAGWEIFGVHDWVPRLIGPIAAFLDILLTAVLCLILWPQDDNAWRFTGFLLVGSIPFAVYGSTIMFDALLTVCVLLAAVGIVIAGPYRRWWGWALVGPAIAAGLLIKGPVVLLYILSAAIIVPFCAWPKDGRGNWTGYGAGFVASLIVGAGGALAWAWPAAQAGGAAYGEQILWSQTAGRVTHAFAHERSWWFYIAILPIVFFPWVLWRPMWSRPLEERSLDPGLRFNVLWLLSALTLLSFVSGKQPHYLIPLFPAAALIGARRLSRAQPNASSRPVGLAVLFLVVGVGLFAVRYVPHTVLDLPQPLAIPAWIWVLPVATGVLLFAGGECRVGQHVRVIALASVVLFATIHIAFGRTVQALEDTSPVAHRIAELQANHVPVAHFGHYQGQYGFTGRLTEPLPQLDDRQALTEWCAQHPAGMVIYYWRPTSPVACAESAVFVGNYRGRKVGIIPAGVFAQPSSP